MQLAEGTDNVMLTAAADLHLGTGTENPQTPAEAGPTPAGPRPAARLPYGRLPDAPTAIRAGQPAPVPAGINPVALADIGRALGGTL